MKVLSFLLGFAIIILFVTPVSAAVTWESYSDPERTIACDLFDTYGNPVYMKAEGLPGASKPYKCKFYDGDGYLIQVEDGYSDAQSVFVAMVLPQNFPDSTPGEWTAELYKVQPKEALVATDTFQVTENAVPEFPTIIAGIMVGLTCGIIYLKKRSKCQSKHI